MMEGLSIEEISDYADALRRRGRLWQIRSQPPWETLNGFADLNLFSCALARSWPVFPLVGDYLRLIKILDWNAPMIPLPIKILVVPCDEFSLY